MLREVKALGDAAVMVLGNHDLHLLTVAAGHQRAHRKDTIGPILDAPDRADLIEWLCARRLVAIEDERLLVHAGLLPQWDARHRAHAFARSRVDARERARRRVSLCLYGDEPRAWRDDLEGFDRLRVVVNACTRLRFCAADGTMEFREKRGPESAPEGYLPWFMHPQRASAGVTVVCGHWSTLELKLAPNLLMLDSGCLWGGALTAVRLEDRRVFQVPGASPLTPKPFE